MIHSSLILHHNIGMKYADEAFNMGMFFNLKGYIPPERKIPGVGGWRWAMPPTPEFCVGDTNMLVYFGVTPDANPRRQPVEYRWRWVFWRWPCIFHVEFMLFVQLFPRWQRENQPTQRKISVEYRLKASFKIDFHLSAIPRHALVKNSTFIIMYLQRSF